MDGLEKTFDLKLELWSELREGLNHEISWCSKGLHKQGGIGVVRKVNVQCQWNEGWNIILRRRGALDELLVWSTSLWAMFMVSLM